MNTLSSLPPEVSTQMVMRMLARPRPDLIGGFGSFYVSMEQNQGNIARFSRYDNLPSQPVPLGPSGVNPPPMALNRLDTDAQIQWYGGYTAITEQVLLINEDRVLVNTVDLLAQSLNETEDQLMRENQVNTSAFINCVNGTNGDNPTELTLADLNDLYTLLRGNNAKRMMDIVEGQDRFGTGPVRQCYYAKTSTSMASDLRQVTGYQNVANYPSQDSVREEEECTISNFRFFLSSLWPESANASALGATVENIICQGQEATCNVELNDYNVQYRYTPKEIAGGPLWLYQTSGYIFAAAPKVVNTTWIYNLRCTLRP